MLNYSLAIEALKSRVSFEQTRKPKFPKLAEDLLRVVGQNSLLFSHIEDGRAFLSNENIYRTVEEFRQEIIDNYNEYDPTITYQEGEWVCYTDSLKNTFAYVARTSIINIDPEMNTNEVWESDLSHYLRSIRDQAIIQLINEVITERNVLGDVKELIDLSPLFAQYRERETIPNDYVALDPEPKSKGRGYQIEQVDAKHIQTGILQIGLISDTAQSIPFYVYHSSQIEPIATFTLQVIAGTEKQFVWYDLHDEVILNFSDPRYNTGGYFRILFYDQDLIEGSHIIGFNSLYSLYKNKLFANSFVPTDLDYDQADYPANPPIDTYNVSSFTPFNLQLETRSNYLYSVERNPSSWDKALQYKIATTVISDMLSSTRLSKENNQIQKSMNMLLKGTFSENGKELHKGLYSRLESYKDQIKIDLSELDPICLKDQTYLQYQY